MFSATGGQYLQFCSQDQCPSASSHKIPIFAFPYERVCTPLHNICNTPHRHAQTLGTFSSGLWKLPLLRLRHLPIPRQAEIRKGSLPKCNHPPPSERLVATLHGWYEWNCSFYAAFYMFFLRISVLSSKTKSALAAVFCGYFYINRPWWVSPLFNSAKIRTKGGICLQEERL